MSNSGAFGISRILGEVNKRHGDMWHEDAGHVAPNRWTLGTWKSKCHILFMHELRGGKGCMRNTWHGDCHVSK